MNTNPDDKQHGVKRRADDGLDDEQRFTKRFNLLNIVEGQPSKLYIPVDPLANNEPQPDPGPDSMAVDDTPHRVYISDLSAELASIDADERANAPRLIFLPDIEKALASVPPTVLRGGSATTEQGKELVLFSTPSTAEDDMVRQAIDEMKRRAREKLERREEAVETAHGYDYGEYNVQEAAQEMADDEENDYMDVE